MFPRPLSARPQQPLMSESHASAADPARAPETRDRILWRFGSGRDGWWARTLPLLR